MSSLFQQAVTRLAETLAGMGASPEEAAEYALRPDTEVTVVYRLPGAPPTGSHVMTGSGTAYMRLPESGGGIWGLWERQDGSEDPVSITWWELLSHGPLFLLPENEEQRALAFIYGPAGGRWGDPDYPCPFKECVMGVGHIGPHHDADNNPLGLTVPDPDGKVHTAGITPHEASQVICTCGTPAMHKPDCPRYPRLTGNQEESS